MNYLLQKPLAFSRGFFSCRLRRGRLGYANSAEFGRISKTAYLPGCISRRY